MRTTTTKIVSFISAALFAITTFSGVATAQAAEIPAYTTTTSNWNVTTLAVGGSAWRVEAYKVDRGLVAWTETDISGLRRRLYTFDGTNTRLLADMAKTEWNDADASFVEPVKGDFDVADGLVVWTMSDTNDREIYSFDGESVKKVSDNSYDDRHPVTGGGRVAWTSTPTSGGAYNLMIKDRSGVRKLASWHVLNYAFSGNIVYWLNQLPNENWFRVFRNDGVTRTVGEADDRPLKKYFFTDGKGTAAWEYSTKQWNYDKRRVYRSLNGNDAALIIQRDVPPNVTRVEDIDAEHVILNVTDLLYTKLYENTQLIDATASVEQTVSRKDAMSKVRFMNGGYVRQREPNVNTGLVFRAPTREDFITLDPIIKDRFDADGAVAIGARVGGGVVLYADGKTDSIPSTVEATDVVAKNGDVVWFEGVGTSMTLKYATRPVLVKSVGVAKTVSGYLVKTSTNSAVYLAAQDGKRYVFTNESAFLTWFPNFASVRTVSAGTLAAMPLGGNVLYHPGSRLLKSAVSTTIYSVGNDSAIHWIADESIARSLFGNDWKARIDTVDDTLLAQYAIGQPVTVDSMYSMTLALR